MPFLGVKVGVFRPSLDESLPRKSNDESSSVSITKQNKVARFIQLFLYLKMILFPFYV